MVSAKPQLQLIHWNQYCELFLRWIYGLQLKTFTNKARKRPELTHIWVASTLKGARLVLWHGSIFRRNPAIHGRRTPLLLLWKIWLQEWSSFQLSTLSQDWWFITRQSQENTDSQPSHVPREWTKLPLTANWKQTFVNSLSLTSAPWSAKCLALNSPSPPSSFLWLMFKRSAVRQCARQAIFPRISEGLLEVTTN